MLGAGLLRVTSRLCLLLMAGAIFLAFLQEQAIGWYIVAVLFFGFAIFTQLKAKEKSIQAKVQIEEKERARIQARRRK